MKDGLCVIISGPSGAGKSTLIRHLNQRMPSLRFSVSCTTRAPRPGEVDGVHYRFLDRERFQELLAQGGFLEHAEVHGNFYGTPRQPVTDAIDAGETILLDIDVQGARQVLAALAGTRYAPHLRTIFISPPNLQELERRLRGRGTETEASLQRRLQNAAGEMECAGEYQHNIVNDDQETAAEQLYAAVTGVAGKTQKKRS